MSEGWTGIGPVYSLAWGGRDWVLDLGAREPGLLTVDGRLGPILALGGLRATGWKGFGLFGSRGLVSHECRFGRVEARYRHPMSETLALRAAWSPGPGGAVDLEIQVQVSSVGEWQGVEVSVGGTLANPRESDGRSVTVEVPSDEGRPSVYLEFPHPDDLAPRHAGGGKAQPVLVTDRTWSHHLFGHDLERGVVLRGRVRGIWLPTRPEPAEVDRLVQSFLAEPPPLGT